MRLVALLACLTAILIPGTLRAGPITSNGNLRDLAFGNVLPGVNESVAYTDATSARWSFKGDNNAEVSLDFTVLPSSLVKGGDNLTVTFSSTDAAWNFTDDPGSATPFDPAVGATANLDINGKIWIWLGGTAQPTGGQASGVYSDTFTLDVSYTGN